MADINYQFVAPVAGVKRIEAERRLHAFNNLTTALMPESPDLAIFVLTEMEKAIDGKSH